MIVLLATRSFLYSQFNDTITEKEVSRIIHYLASDSLKGRGNGRPELLKAAKFIGEEFRKNNLAPLPGLLSYFIPFRPFGGRKNVVIDNLLWNGTALNKDDFIYLHPDPGNYFPKTIHDFKVIKLDKPFSEDILEQFSNDSSSLLIWTDKKQADGANIFPDSIKIPFRGIKDNRLLAYAETRPYDLLLTGNESFYSLVEYNLVGMLPGKTKPGEVIIFSAHYDHEGVYGRTGDSILNGANDNASGTTALLLLAQYFSKRNDNDRTILFCAFAAEELGLLGSNDLLSYLTLKNIIAGINIEMIGVPHYGKNRIFITGEKYSDLPRILEKNLKNTGIRVRSEPDEKKQLFQRSDNYPFALKGVPFHTIMASDDDDACYHQPCDEIKRIDIANMIRIIKAIAFSARRLVSGEVTPRRINPSEVEIKKL